MDHDDKHPIPIDFFSFLFFSPHLYIFLKLIINLWRSMASSSSSAAAHPKILEEIVEAGKKAFDPNNDASTRASGLEAYDKLIER